eukprot:5078157-Alexandrium_andersonii.AAC.1
MYCWDRASQVHTHSPEAVGLLAGDCMPARALPSPPSGLCAGGFASTGCVHSRAADARPARRPSRGRTLPRLISGARSA